MSSFWSGCAVSLSATLSFACFQGFSAMLTFRHCNIGVLFVVLDNIGKILDLGAFKFSAKLLDYRVELANYRCQTCLSYYREPTHKQLLSNHCRYG